MRILMRLIFPPLALGLFVVFAAPLAASAQCHGSDANKIYAKFRDNIKTEDPAQQKIAYETGKEYLQKYSNCSDESDKTITTYITNWIAKYEDVTLLFNCTDAVNKDPKSAFDKCDQVAAKHPDDPKPFILIVAAGGNVSRLGDRSFNARAAKGARAALDLIAAGKTTDSYSPFADKQEAIGGLNYYLGAFSFETSPKDAAAALLLAVKSNTKFSQEPTTYQMLGISYYNGEYASLAAQYKAACEGKPASSQCDSMFEAAHVALDHVVDAYARAVALSLKAPDKYPDIERLKAALVSVYKARHDNSDTGLDQFLATVLDKPVPEPK